MAKILEFRRVKQEVKKTHEPALEADDLENEIWAIMNDYSLTPANRRWILENMLMDMDDQLEEYKKELERAERKLHTVVKAAEKEIATAYNEFDAHVQGMTRAVRRLTRTRRVQQSADASEKQPDRVTPQQ